MKLLQPAFLCEIEERRSCAVQPRGDVSLKRVALEDLLKRRDREEALKQFEAKAKAIFA